MYGLQGFFFENCTDRTDFFKKMYGSYGFFSENCTDCTDFFWKCTDFCTNFFKKVLATLYWYDLCVRNMSPELQPMAVQYHCHMSPIVSRDQYTALPLEGVLVMRYGHISYIYTFWYNFNTVLCQFLETGTLDRCLICLNKLLRFSGFSLYTPFIFPFQSL